MPLSTINSNSIANGTVIASDILDGTISTSKLVAANIAGDRIAANTLSNTVFQTGSVENYLNAQSGGALSSRNRIINGAMQIDQRNAGASITPTDGQYSVDRWGCRLSQSAKYSAQQDSSANTVAGFTSSLKVTSLSSYSVGSGDNFQLQHRIEGLNFGDMRWGTANASPVTLSFWVRSSLTGTFGGAVTNADGNRSYPFTYTISAADTWEKKTITIPGDTSGTWNTSTGRGLELNIGLGAGSTYSGTAGSWSSNFYVTATGATSVVGTNGATWYITGVQLEKGSIATSFEYRQYTAELQLCQRYYQVIGIFGINAPASTTTSVFYHTQTFVTMRTAPTVSFGAATFDRMTNYDVLDYYGTYTPLLSDAVSSGIAFRVDRTSGSTWTANAPLAVNTVTKSHSTIKASAEL